MKLDIRRTKHSVSWPTYYGTDDSVRSCFEPVIACLASLSSLSNAV